MAGGNSDNGGLSNVNWDTPDNRNDNSGFRPLSVSRPILGALSTRVRGIGFSGGFDPAAKLSADLSRLIRKVEVSLLWQSLRVISEAEHDLEKIKSNARFGKQFSSRVASCGVCSNNESQKVHCEHLKTLANRISVLLRKFTGPLMNGKKQLVGAMENGKIKTVVRLHRVPTLYERIISCRNLMRAWQKFRCGKQSRADVLRYERHLGDNILDLHYSLRNKTYQHGGYDSFFVQDPKHRHIHKASVRDRIVHHAIVRMIEPMFERKFIFDSWSCRKKKGTHAAVVRFRKIAWSLSRNNTVPVWVLKMDISKFFASVDQDVLLDIIGRTVKCKDTCSLIANVLRSFDKGLPLGNLTSQLLANVYLSGLDMHVKHALRVPHYLRYCDDFVILGRDPEALQALLPSIKSFLEVRLRLQLHPAKITLSRLSEGVDFLGFVCFPYHVVLRTKTKRRMLARVGDKNLSSYLGLISHTRSHRLKKTLLHNHHEHRSPEDGGEG